MFSHQSYVYGVPNPDLPHISACLSVVPALSSTILYLTSLLLVTNFHIVCWPCSASQTRHWENLSKLSKGAKRFEKSVEDAKQKQLEVHCGR
eukprot:1158941-Pelagomonas_calceolata.AAC.2